MENYFTCDGARYTGTIQLGGLLGKGTEGGEGGIYSIVNNRVSCAKLYNQRLLTNETLQKVLDRIKNKPATLESQFCRICWPKLMLTDSNRKFKGFTMDIANNSKSLFMLTQIPATNGGKYDNAIESTLGWWSSNDNIASKASYYNRLRIMHRITGIVLFLHSTGYHIPDLKPENLMFDLNLQVSLVDTDSLLGKNDRSSRMAATPEYMAPELHTSKPDQRMNVVSDATDAFAMAVIFYELLTGIHPYSCVPKDKSMREQGWDKFISNGLFIHGKRGNLIESAKKHHLRFVKLPVSIQKLFIQSFDETIRPSIMDWRTAIEMEIAHIGGNKSINTQVQQQWPINPMLNTYNRNTYKPQPVLSTVIPKDVCPHCKTKYQTANSLYCQKCGHRRY
jgi:DNA-binding helix-hairpin-helix protein with protein kinase domain